MAFNGDGIFRHYREWTSRVPRKTKTMIEKKAMGSEGGIKDRWSPLRPPSPLGRERVGVPDRIPYQLITNTPFS